MNKSRVLLTIAISSLFSADVFADKPPEKLLQQVQSSYICLFEENISPTSVPQLAQQVITKVGGKKRHIFNHAVRGFSSHMSAKAAEQLVLHNPNIAMCEANGLTQAGAKGGNGNKPGQSKTQITPLNIALIGGPGNGIGKTAWVIDSGIDTNHPDLNVNVELAANFVSLGKNTIEDGSGHGTHVAGTLAAKGFNNEADDIDVVGVAAGATVIPVRVLHNSNWGAIDDMVAGIDYVTSKYVSGIHSKIDVVANMSVWAYGHYKSLHDASMALANQIPFVVIAGNDAEDINNRPSEPSHVVHPNLYTVSVYGLHLFCNDYCY